MTFNKHSFATGILCLFLALVAVGSAAARSYAPADVPNVHTADRTRFLVNPDGIISADAQTRIDSLVAALRHATTAEMSVVVIDDISDPDDIDMFATDLFSLWGLGKKDRDNGVLLLVAKDRRKAVIRTGYGAEGILPDIVCGSILREQMFPAFREGDYDRGVVDATATITRLLSDPDAAEELRSALEDADRQEDRDFFVLFLVIAACITGLMLLVLAAGIYNVRNRSRFEKYTSLATWKPVYLILGFATLGMGMIAAVWLVALLWRWRNGRRACPNCGTVMRKIGEVHDNDYLTPAQDIEERAGSVDYDVWLCPDCGETDILPYINRASTMQECEACHARLARLSADRIIRRATTATEGIGMREYTCLNCRHITRRQYNIAKTAPIVILPLGSGGSGSGSGGGSFGGGFGGGMTGGGGASGGW